MSRYTHEGEHPGEATCWLLRHRDLARYVQQKTEEYIRGHDPEVSFFDEVLGKEVTIRETDGLMEIPDDDDPPAMPGISTSYLRSSMGFDNE